MDQWNQHTFILVMYIVYLVNFKMLLTIYEEYLITPSSPPLPSKKYVIHERKEGPGC